MRFRHIAALAFLASSLADLCLPSPALCSWERVNEFYGTMTITYVIDHEAALEGQKHIRRKNATATVNVNGSTFDGAYHWPVGTMTGTMSSESIITNLDDGSTVHGTFTGRIDRQFNADHHGGPGLKVNKEKKLYQISLPHLYAKGVATVTVTGMGGPRKDPNSEEDAAPVIPESYRRGGVSYEPEKGFIGGGFNHSVSVPSYPKPIVVTTIANWHFTFDLPPLRAEAGPALTVERGGKVTLDGTASTGKITEYCWTFEATDCPEGTDVSHVEIKGATAEITALCSLEAKLTVSDGTDEDVDITAIRVEPRKWKTFFEHVDEPIMLRGGDLYPTYIPNWTVPKYDGGENVCSYEGHPQTYHNFHPPRENDSWEGGYTLELIRDTGGPFDGYWYVSEYDLEISRVTALNPYLIKGGPPPDGTLQSFYDKNSTAGMNIDGYLKAIEDHEKLHSTLKEYTLRNHDPAEYLEGKFMQDRDVLKEEVGREIREAEWEICDRSKDPLPEKIKHFKLWFISADTGQFTVEGIAPVGGQKGYSKAEMECIP